nr:hypothetical protein [Pontibacter vulgaris]
MPTYLFAFILYYLPVATLSLPLQSRWIVLSMIFFSTFIIPGLGAYAMVRSGQLDSVEMHKREQRRTPLLFTGLCYSTTAYLLHREPAFDQIFYFIMGLVAATVFLTFVVSLFWKVSAHGVGLGGTLAILLMLHKIAPDFQMVQPVVFSTLIAGAVLSARLALHAHTPAQVYAGFASGFLLVYMAGIIGF